jgi:hypothetical protein
MRVLWGGAAMRNENAATKRSSPRSRALLGAAGAPGLTDRGGPAGQRRGQTELGGWGAAEKNRIAGGTYQSV